MRGCLTLFVRTPALAAGFFFLIVVAAGAQSYPRLTTEISPDHPLLVFATPPPAESEPDAYAQRIIGIWNTLPASLRPFSALLIHVESPDSLARHAKHDVLFAALQTADVSAVVQLADGNPNHYYLLELAEELLRDYTCIRGIWAADVPFREYTVFSGGDALGIPPHIRWLTGAMEIAARYGRFLAIRLGSEGWTHAMANASSRALFDAMRACNGYVFAVAGLDGHDAITQQTAAMGLWLEGSVAQWGVAATPKWFENARFIQPGVYGVPPAGVSMPAHYYRAMILNGAMCGATIYAIESAPDLWAGERAGSWQASIHPTLRETVEWGLIVRKEFVAKKTPVAYQLGISRTPWEFRANLRDLDGELESGLLIHGAYGMDRPGQVAELVANTGSHYWVPVLSAFAPPNAVGSFARVVQPNALNTPEEWTRLLEQFLVPDGTGTAFICTIGRGAFVMHTKENLYEEQSFRLPALPAPVRGIEAKRQDQTVAVSWNFREGDVSFRVFKRAYPDGAFELAADKVEQRTWTDLSVEPSVSVAYAVTALTNEREPYEGTVNYGDYLAFSMVQSRIEEEAVITPLVASAQAQPVTKTDIRPKTQEWWPLTEGAPETHRADARDIAARIEQWDQAFVREDLDGVMDLYSTEYQDPEWWRFQYVKRAYQWFFERYSSCRMARQIRTWDFSHMEDTGHVRVLLYCRFSGVAISDPTGRVAGVRASFPRHESGEVWLTFTKKDGTWRLERTEPALPNFNEILSYSAGPYDDFAAGPDVPGQPPAVR